MTKRLILVIDDDEKICFTIKKMLEASGKFEVKVAHNGKAGLRVAAQWQPDLILLDIEMPKMDGLEVLRRLNKANLNEARNPAPVIMVTALDNEDAISEALYEYAEHYIVKPVDLEALEAQIADILARTVSGK